MRARTSLTRTAKAGTLLAFAASLLLAPLAHAQGRADTAPTPVPDAREVAGQAIREPPPTPPAKKTIDRIVRELEEKHKARVVREPEERVIDGRKVLTFRLLDDKNSKVKQVRVDAETGKEL